MIGTGAEERLRFLVHASTTLGTSLDYAETLRTVSELAVPALGDFCLLEVLEDGQRTPRRIARAVDPALAGAVSAVATSARPEAPGSTIAERLAARGEPIVSPDSDGAIADVASGDTPVRTFLERVRPKSAFAVPLVGRGVVGALLVGTSSSERRFVPDDVDFTRDFGRCAALALDNAWLFQRVNAAVQIRDEVLAIVSHDLRTPIGNVMLTADLLLEELGDDELKRKQIAVVRRAAERMTRLIQDLLDVARLEGGKLPLDRKAEDVASIIADANDLFAPSANERGLRLEVESAPGLPPIECDRERLLQVLSNLLGNAIKFTERGSVSLRAEASGSDVLFCISDTGSGIAPSDLPHLFEWFWQARRAKRGGAGLGLAIAKGLVEAHGGRIWVESEPKRGTTFFFTVPAR